MGGPLYYHWGERNIEASFFGGVVQTSCIEQSISLHHYIARKVSGSRVRISLRKSEAPKCAQKAGATTSQGSNRSKTSDLNAGLIL